MAHSLAVGNVSMRDFLGSGKHGFGVLLSLMRFESPAFASQAILFGDVSTPFLKMTATAEGTRYIKLEENPGRKKPDSI